MMRFERAITNAPTLFLFDRRSQQQLQEMAREALPGSRDRYLIRLSQAAFAFYNAGEIGPDEMRAVIRHAQDVLREVKRFREDRVFYTLALRLEVDLLMQLSALAYQEAPPGGRERLLYNEEDTRALSICDTLLKNFPPTWDPYPSAWYSGVVPLFPPYKDAVLRFYKDRVQEHRIEQLQTILRQVKEELTVAAGMMRAKQFFAENGVRVRDRAAVGRFLATNIPAVTRFVQNEEPQLLQLASDITLPRGVTAGHLDRAVQNVQGQIEQARREKDIRKYTGHLLQLGILYFLQERPEDAVATLVRTLQASARIGAEDKRIRQYRHEEFPDIPFMIGTSFLRMRGNGNGEGAQRERLLENATAGLMQAILLQPHYHQAFVNLVAAVYGNRPENGDAEPGAPEGRDGAEALIRLYLSQFDRDIARVSGLAMRNLAYLMLQEHGERVTPEIVQWMIVGEFCTGGEQTRAKKMLQELKTLYILNAHDFSAAYLDAYRTALRVKDEEFVKDLQNDELHSALLFYIAHAFTSLSLQQGRETRELVIDYGNLDQGIELNAEALYFHPRNGSALRLVETQSQIIQFALQRTQRRWENITNAMGQRFQFYEEYLRQEKSHRQLTERLENLHLGEHVPPLRLSSAVAARMNELLTVEQRDRLRNRVEAT